MSESDPFLEKSLMKKTRFDPNKTLVSKDLGRDYAAIKNEIFENGIFDVEIRDEQIIKEEIDALHSQFHHKLSKTLEIVNKISVTLNEYNSLMEKMNRDQQQIFIQDLVQLKSDSADFHHQQSQFLKNVFEQ